MGTESIKLILIAGLLLVFGLTGCSAFDTRGIEENITTTTKANGDVIEVVKRKVGGDIAAMQLSVQGKEAKARVIEAVGWMDPEAQEALAIRGNMWTDDMASYIRGEIAEGQQLKDGATGGIWGLVGLGGVYGATKVLKAGVDNAGANTSNINTNSRVVSNSPDGSASGDGDIGSGIVNQQENIDKNLTTPAQNPESSFDGPDSQKIVDPDTVNAEIKVDGI